MVNVGKREDAMLDTIGQYRDRQLKTLYWLKVLEDGELIAPSAAEHLRKTLTEDTEKHDVHGARDIGIDAEGVSGGSDDGHPAVQRT